MGYYIQTPGQNKGKAQYIIENYGASLLDYPPEHLPTDQAIICVVDNGPFEATGFAYSEAELIEFRDGDGGRRPKTWLSMNLERAKELSGFVE